MNILVFNCGSSSLKYSLMAMPWETVLASGEAQRVGPETAEQPRIIHNDGSKTETHYRTMPDHSTAFDEVMSLIRRNPSLTPSAVGHRMVHGGAEFSETTLVTGRVRERLQEIQELAPIHNPPAIQLIEACSSRYPDIPQVVVFDTAFHSTIPDYASSYALPKDLTQELGIRKYGFHGISHKYVVNEAAQYMGIPAEEFSAVSCHLGSGGASLCAVVDGCSVDNTMGYSPLQGLVMSTRCGDLSPAITLGLLARSVGDVDAVEDLLNRQSGILGISGVSGDIRDIFKASDKQSDNSERINLALRVYLWRIRKYLGSYLAVVGTPDAVIFTDTIGETQPQVRWAVASDMQTFGIDMDSQKNEEIKELPADISSKNSKVRVLVLRTNEELAIAREAFRRLWDSVRPTVKGY